MAAVEIVIVEHGRVLLQFAQQLPGAVVAGKDTGKLHVKGFKGGQVQKQAAGHRLKAAVHRCLKMGEQFPPHIRIHGFIIVPAVPHLMAQDTERQRVALAAFLNRRHLRRCGGNAGERQQLFRCFLVQKQVFGFKDLHPPLIAEGHQPAGDSPRA